MKPNLCPSCQRPLHDHGVGAMLPPTKRRIYEAVAAAGEYGITRWDVMDKVYANNGGREGETAIKVHVCQMNKLMRPFGVKIIADRREHVGGSGLYRLVATPEAQG